MNRMLCIHRKTCGMVRPNRARLALLTLALTAPWVPVPAWAAMTTAPTALSIDDFMYRCGWLVGERHYTALSAWEADPKRSRSTKPVMEARYPERCLADLEAKLAAEQSRLPAGQNIRQKLKSTATRGMTCARDTHNGHPCKP